jgi:crotonobetainyl-CoA:carnitine CoA-transferase CaiB-like acyl-CoA transferase
MNENLTLAGVRVLDLGQRTSTAWCSRLLSDYGADVIAQEDHPLRNEGPFDGDGNSVPAQYFLVAKRFAHSDAIEQLIPQADIILTDALPGSALSPETLISLNPDCLVCAITPYGIDGELADRPGNDLTACASSGWAYVNGLQGKPPLKCSGYQASYQSGTFAFGTLIAALLDRLANGRHGQIIDIAEREVLVSTAAPAPLRYQYSGFNWARKSGVDVNEGPVPVKDGWFALTMSRPLFWIKAMELLGLPDLAEDSDLQQAGLRHKHKEKFVDRVAEAMGQWKRMDLFNALGERRVIAGPVLRMDELGENPQFLARGFFRKADNGVTYPGPFARMAVSGWRAPKVSQDHTEKFDNAERVKTKPVRAGGRGKGPLSGFRGLVLTQAWAGTYATELLALLGAEVIQLETRGRLDSWRGTYQNPIPRGLQDRDSAKHSWNCSPLYNSVNLNKRCITVDLSEPEGVQLFRDLVVHADFVAENFSPRVMGNLGIDYEKLREINPGIVMASLSAYGANGPWAHVPGIGGTIEPSSGMSALLGYKGEHPLNSGQMYPDPVAGLCGFSAILMALFHRDRTGEGQYIDLSMQEANFTFIGDAWLEFATTGNVRGPLGNSHHNFAPHNIYPASGEDEWIAIAVETDKQWRALCETLEITSPERWPDATSRKVNEDEIDDLVAEAVAGHEKVKLAEALCNVGIPSSPVFAPNEIAAEEPLRRRGHMVQIEHPEAGPAWQSTLPAKFSETTVGTPRHAPLQGQHSLEVFQEFLGMDKTLYDDLSQRGITGIGPTGKSTVANQA